MPLRDVVLVAIGILIGFDICCLWWIWTIERANRRHSPVSGRAR